MKPQKIYDIFTEALANEKIKAELIEILEGKAEEDHIEGQTELFPSGDASALSAENAALSRQIALLELETGRLQSQNSALAARLKRCQASLDEYSSAFAMPISVYDKYRSLSAETAEALSKYFRNNTPGGFFICGVQRENLAGLRDVTEKLIFEDCEKFKRDISILNELYTYLLTCLNSTLEKPVYRLTEAAAGDKFDEKLHHSIGGEKSGIISEVIIQGCISEESGGVIRKAIVKI